MATCKICGEEISNHMVGIHVKKYHHISCKEYYDQYLKTPEDGICPTCGQLTKFINISNGYHVYCCKQCANANIYNKTKQTKLERYGDPNYNNPEKNKKTCLERYGATHASSIQSVKNKISESWKNKTEEEKLEYKNKKINEWAKKTKEEKQLMVQKVKQTKLERYGDPNYNNPEKNKKTCLKRYGEDNAFKLKETKEKIKKSLNKKYGVDHPAQSDKVIQKMKQTCLEKYGVESYSQTKQLKELISKSRISKILKDNEDILNVHIDDNGDILYECKCPHLNCNKCREKTYIIGGGHRAVRKNQGTEPCTKLLPIDDKLNKNTSLEVFVHRILDEHNIKYETNNRSILNGKELDIYIPDYNIAIECNGVYWHSKKDKQYHYKKWQICTQQNIQLLSLWEDWIINKPNIIENIILSKLGIYKQKIYARNCNIMEIDSKTSKNFLEQNHLQGNTNGSIRLGLFYNNELVSLMVFGSSRKALGSNKMQKKYELYRFCNKNYTLIIGGADKLFKFFIQNHPDCIIESFSSNDISLGKLYEKLGFHFDHVQPYSYWYIDKSMNRHHRFSFRKDILIKNGADPNLSESEIVKNMDLKKIYDSGQIKWIYKS